MCCYCHRLTSDTCVKTDLKNKSTVVRLSAIFVTYLMTSSLLRHDVEGITLAPVSWNMSNPIFKTSKNDHVIEVKLYDDIDFLCPYYPAESTDSHVTNTSSSLSNDLHRHHHRHHLEHYIVYMVSKSEYMDCNVYDELTAVMMLNCSNPRHRKRFTILFEPFQSIPNAPEYNAGGTYYFITTSTGSRHGMSNLYQGACSSRNMKLTIRVCCRSPTAVKTKHSDVVAKTKYNNGLNTIQQLASQHWQTVPYTTPSDPASNDSSPATLRPIVRQPSGRHRHRHTMRPFYVKTTPISGKSRERALLDEEANSVGKLIEDMASVKQAGLYTSTGHSQQSAPLFCALFTLLLFAAIRFVVR